MVTRAAGGCGRLILLLLACLAATRSGCGGEVPTPCDNSGDGGVSGVKRIVILTNGNNPFWDPCEAGATEAEREFKLIRKPVTK